MYKINKKFVLYNIWFLMFILNIILYLNYEWPVKMTIFMTFMHVVFSLLIIYVNKSGFAFVYLIYLSLAHFGIYFVTLFVNDPFIEYQGEFEWYYRDFKNLLILVILSLTIFSYTSVLISFRLKNNKNKLIEYVNKGNKYFFNIGIIFIILFTINFLMYIATGQIKLFGNYSEFHEGMSELPFYSYAITFLSIGIAFTFSNVSKNNIKLLLLILSIPTILLLLTGNRGEIMYPLFASVGVLIIRNFKFKKVFVLIIAFVFFVLIPIVKEVRVLNTKNINDIQINWFSSFIELGYTLRPFGYTKLWINHGESLAYGMSYVAPFQRMLANMLPSIDKIDYEMELYGFRYRLPGMGYSVISESYYNFGSVGIIIVMSIIAFLCYKMAATNNFERLSLFTAIVSILLNNIRNAFSFVPGQIIIVIFIYLMIIYFSKIKKLFKNNRRHT